jgi:hypothetical protein
MSEQCNYRIEYVIKRRLIDEDDFTEIGFGSTGMWANVDAAEYEMHSAIQSREWETDDDMPDPTEVDA